MAELISGQKKDKAINELLDRLTSNDPEIRAAANREMDAIPLCDVIGVLEKIYKFPPRNHRRNAFFVGLVAAASVFILCNWSLHMIAALILSALAFVVGAAFASASLLPALQQRIFVTITERMEEVTDITDLKMILDFMQGTYSQSRNQNTFAFFQYDVDLKVRIREALNRLLSQLDRKVYQSLTKLQQECFYYLLQETYQDMELTRLLLKTIGEYDDLKSWYVRSKLEELANQGAPTANMKEVKQAAKMALARVQERREKEKEAQTLLRGSNLPTAAQSGVLLRPAAPHEQTPNEQLLRASNSDDTSSRL